MSRVHFTHHPCVVHDMWKPKPADEPCRRSPFYISGRNPHLSVCRYWTRNKRKHGYTVNPDEVTCTLCASSLTKDTKEKWAERAAQAQNDPEVVRDENIRYWSGWRSDRELTVIAWFDCCRHYGAPWPFGERERITVERRLRAVQITEAVFTSTLLGRLHAPMAPSLARQLDKFDPVDRHTLEPLLALLKEADAMLDRVRSITDEAASRADAIAARLRSNALISVSAEAS